MFSLLDCLAGSFCVLCDLGPSLLKLEELSFYFPASCCHGHAAVSAGVRKSGNVLMASTGSMIEYDGSD